MFSIERASGVATSNFALRGGGLNTTSSGLSYPTSPFNWPRFAVDYFGSGFTVGAAVGYSHTATTVRHAADDGTAETINANGVALAARAGAFGGDESPMLIALRGGPSLFVGNSTSALAFTLELPVFLKLGGGYLEFGPALDVGVQFGQWQTATGKETLSHRLLQGAVLGLSGTSTGSWYWGTTTNVGFFLGVGL